MEDIFGAAKMSSIYLVCLKIPDIFWGERFMLGPSLRMKKMRVPPPHPLGFVHQFKPIPVKCL